MQWMIDNWDSILAALVAFSAFFALLAKLTPWGWDDKLSAMIQNGIGLIKRVTRGSKDVGTGAN